MAKRTCSIDGCDRISHARGWCQSHYRRWYCHGDPTSYGTSGRARKGEARAFFHASMQSTTDDCIIWPFGLSQKGYGEVTVEGGGYRQVHALACEIAHGMAPDGMIATHGECHNRACFNPRHLSWATPIQNALDRRRDGTQLEGVKVWNAKLDDDKVREIRRLRSEGFTLQWIGEEYGVTTCTVSAAARGATWKHVS